MTKDLSEEIIRFRDERDWRQFHNPKDLAVSISLEAAELLECFQWRTSEEAIAERAADISAELADVLIYCFTLADALGVDVADIIRAKLSANADRYPVDRSYGSRAKYTSLRDLAPPEDAR